MGTFYIAADGSPDLYQYNDLPVAFDANVNIGEIPYTPPTFAGGQAPTLTAAEIDDVIAFLCTLTDGYDPNNPGAYNIPAQCQPQAQLDAHIRKLTERSAMNRHTRVPRRWPAGRRRPDCSAPRRWRTPDAAIAQLGLPCRSSSRRCRRACSSWRRRTSALREHEKAIDQELAQLKAQAGRRAGASGRAGGCQQRVAGILVGPPAAATAAVPWPPRRGAAGRDAAPGALRSATLASARTCGCGATVRSTT